MSGSVQADSPFLAEGMASINEFIGYCKLNTGFSGTKTFKDAFGAYADNYLSGYKLYGYVLLELIGENQDLTLTPDELYNKVKTYFNTKNWQVSNPPQTAEPKPVAKPQDKSKSSGSIKKSAASNEDKLMNTPKLKIWKELIDDFVNCYIEDPDSKGKYGAVGEKFGKIIQMGLDLESGLYYVKERAENKDIYPEYDGLSTAESEKCEEYTRIQIRHIKNLGLPLPEVWDEDLWK